MRTLFAMLLVALAPSLALGAAPEQAVARLWQALSHGPASGGDVAALRELFHADAVVMGGRYQSSEPRLSVNKAADFITAVGRAAPEPFHECEVSRTVHRYDRFAAVYSIVESRRDKSAAAPDFVGVNSIQLYKGSDGWTILSLYYHVEREGLPVPLADGVPGRCLDGAGSAKGS